MNAFLERWRAHVGHSDKPAYLALADAIAADVAQGRLMPGDRLPALRPLASHLGKNYSTAARGYAEAQQRGLIGGRAGQGTYVCTVAPPPAPRPAGHGSLLEMTMNLPPEPRDASLLERMAAGFRTLADPRRMHDLLRYQEFGGSNDDRDAGIRWLGARVPDVTPERMLVCPGAQGALLGLMATLVRPGDRVCAEAVTYPGIKGIAAQLGVHLVGLASDDEGIDPAAFARVCREAPPQALYTNPTLLNPTTATLSTERRLAIVAIARQYGIPIIEDDAYGALPLRSPPTLASLAPELTYHVTGLAKCVGAGLRVAFVVAPDGRQAKRLAAALRTMLVMACPVSVSLATAWINDGTASAALRAVRAESRARQQLAARLLPPECFRSRGEAFHLWLTLPPSWNRVAFTAQLRARGVGVVGSDIFTVAGPPPDAVRVCLGGPTDLEGTRQALEIIADTLNEVPAVALGVV